MPIHSTALPKQMTCAEAMPPLTAALPRLALRLLVSPHTVNLRVNERRTESYKPLLLCDFPPSPLLRLPFVEGMIVFFV